MQTISMTREGFLSDTQGAKFEEFLSGQDQLFSDLLEFFNQEDHQRRMEESELHHDRPPLAGVVREMETLPQVNDLLGGDRRASVQQLRHVITVMVRMVMDGRGWRRTGRSGTLGIRAPRRQQTPRHNRKGVSFWLVRGERFSLKAGMPYRSVAERCSEFQMSTEEQAGANG